MRRARSNNTAPAGDTLEERRHLAISVSPPQRGRIVIQKPVADAHAQKTSRKILGNILGPACQGFLIRVPDSGGPIPIQSCSI